MTVDSNFRILIGLREVAGYCSKLKKGFDELGVEAHFLDLGGNSFKYYQGKNPAWINVFNLIGDKFGAIFSSNYYLRIVWLIFFQNLLSIPALFISIFRYDVFIFCSNSTFFFFLDLLLLKLLKKKVIYVFLGSDSRPIYLSGYVMGDDKNAMINMLLCKVQKIVVWIIERLADVCINHPPQAYFHERKFVSSLCLGVPVNLSFSPDALKPDENGKVRILHAPSKAGPKGSVQFKAIIEKLKTKGHAIDYVEVSGVTNAEVLRLIDSCDFILDEMYSDTPMALFASEAAASGKPAVVGSYYCVDIYRDISTKYIPPSVFVHPDKIEESIEALITNEDYRRSLGKQAKEFVKNNWDVSHIARNYLRVIKKDIPAEWYYHPISLSYLHGCGLSEKRAKQNIRIFIEKGGIKSLCISDKPLLQKAMRDFAYAN